MLIRCDTCRHCRLFDEPVDAVYHGCKMSVKLTRFDNYCTWWKERDEDDERDLPAENNRLLPTPLFI